MTLGIKGLLNMKLLKAIGIGVGISMLVTFIAVCLCTTLIEKEIDIANSQACTIFIYVLSSFLGGTAAAKTNQDNFFWSISLTAISYFLILFLLSVVLFQGLVKGVGGCLLSVTAGSLVSLFLNLKVKQGKKHRRRRR